MHIHVVYYLRVAVRRGRLDPDVQQYVLHHARKGCTGPCIYVVHYCAHVMQREPNRRINTHVQRGIQGDTIATIKTTVGAFTVANFLQGIKRQRQPCKHMNVPYATTSKWYHSYTDYIDMTG